MFIAMNSFHVFPDQTEAFEAVWRTRDSALAEVPGFAAFRLLRGPETEGPGALRLAHPVGEPRPFEDWTRSEAFRR